MSKPKPKCKTANEAYDRARADALRLARLAIKMIEAENASPNWADVGDANRLRASLWEAIAPFSGSDAWDEVLDARESWAPQIDAIEKAFK